VAISNKVQSRIVGFPIPDNWAIGFNNYAMFLAVGINLLLLAPRVKLIFVSTALPRRLERILQFGLHEVAKFWHTPSSLRYDLRHSC
jgi:hypothetical protein